MTRVRVVLIKNIKNVVVNNMSSLSLIEYLGELVEKDKDNVKTYEDFHENKLANIRDMNPLDSFLYGVACGKLDRSREIKELIEELLHKFSNQH